MERTEGRPLRGVLLFACAIVLFSCLDATSKYLSRTFPVGVIAWARYVVHFVGMTALLAPRMGRSLLSTARPVALGIRGLLLVAVTLLMMAAFRRMPLAEATAVVFVAPLWVTLLAKPLLGEQIGVLRWAAVVVGFVGVVVLARPSSGLDALGTLYAFAASVAYALYQLATRALSRTESAVSMLYFTAIAGTLTLTFASPWLGDVHAPSATEAVLLVCLGLFGGGGHFFLTVAFREAPASLLSPLVYTQLAWAGLLGLVVFGDVPKPSALIGIAIVGSAGLLLAWEARRLTRAPA